MSDQYPTPRELYQDWSPVIEASLPQPLDVEMELLDQGVEQTNRDPGVSAGGPTERV
jgi:hypothetical protein